MRAIDLHQGESIIRQALCLDELALILKMENTPKFDVYKPPEIAELIESAAVAKAKLPFAQLLVFAILAGTFIGFGAAAYTAVMMGVDPTLGPAKLLGGIVFSLGLILIIVGGAELFTGNALMVMAAVDHKISLAKLLRNWGVVYIGNLIVASGLAIAFYFSGLLDSNMETMAVKFAEEKATLPVLEAFVRGALCNALVCLAVWLTFSARTVSWKIFSILWPISGFVLLGLEHSIANMYFFPQGWASDANVTVEAALINLLVVTLGNILGGGGGVALAYRFAYLGPKKR